MYLRVLLKSSLKHLCSTFQSEVRLFECLAHRRLDKLTHHCFNFYSVGAFGAHVGRIPFTFPLG